ncbi:MAG: sodium:proton antiporter NhaD [Gammaproteobacteria bacterium]
MLSDQIKIHSQNKFLHTSIAFALVIIATLFSTAVIASETRELIIHPGTSDPRAIFCVIIFILSYLLVMTEEATHLRKSKPVMLGAGIIWAVIGYAAPDYGVSHEDLKKAISHDLDEYSSLLLFLFAAMTYIAALEAGNVFASLRSWLVSKGFSYRSLFWVTGIIAFFLSAIADNLTTALVMGAVILALGSGNPKFIAIGMVNVVSAANAGGAFSPFGDITTLMVWQSGRVEFFEFFALFLPSVAAFLVPAIIMSFYVPAGAPAPVTERIKMLRGAKRAIALGILTIAMAVSFEQFLGLPPFMGMMTGLSLLMFHAYFLRRTRKEGEPEYDIFDSIKVVEWDTLLFFFGVMFSVGGLAFIGYLELASNALYGDLGATGANIMLGAISAIIDNIPVMVSILSMGPEMNHFQWLLVTLTCGVGGSLLSVGSAAGVALMGSSKGQYTFMGHLKWTPVLILGYASGIGMHFFVNG